MAEALRDVQALFLAGVIRGEAEAERLIVDDNRVGATRRLDIYRNNYRANVTGILADHYERLHLYLGEEQFARLAGAFVDAQPSMVRNLRYYGGGFADYLARHFPEDGELEELARLDWALRDAFDAPDAEPLDADAVGALGDAWIAAPLTLVPSAQFVAASFNIAAIWNALEAEEVPPEAERRDQAETILVWRQGGSPQFRTLGADEAAALGLIAEGCSFTVLSEHMLERLGEAAAMQALGGWLGGWLAEGTVMLAGQAEAGSEVT
ncbi:DNA-binding domain-containing protein [Sphingopyxis sp. PET50]|uniref:HvfC/BufC N-terminal domain-containing protein n=1 Tax=Sphingopyxis sp. PET50 TaxID=2976533 RepID=UPI0021AF3E1F|nr:DNA-binding domain-containing protein [Sphingopyxis sp. PET50]